MDIQALIEKYKKGTFTNLMTSRPGKVRKGVTDNIEKVTMYKGVRFGISYDNIKQTQDKRESGEIPTENAGLPWGAWDNYPFTISHKDNQYLRFYANKDQIKTVWKRNGEVVKKDEVKDLLLASEFRTPAEDKTLTLTIKVDNILG